MLNYQVETLDGLDDAAKSFYAEQDGKFVLQVDGVVPKDRADDLARQLQDAKNEAIDNRKKVKPYETLGTIEEIQAKLADVAKGKNPDHERIVAEMNAAHEAKVAELSGELMKVRKGGALEKLKAELAKADVIPEGLDMLTVFAQSRMEFADDGATRFLSSDGKPLIGSGSDGSATISDFAKMLAKENPMLVNDAGTGGGGTPPKGKGGTPDKTVTRAQFDTMSHADRSAFSKSGGKVVD